MKLLFLLKCHELGLTRHGTAVWPLANPSSSSLSTAAEPNGI